jgi:methyl-accepting chemotaxis protein
MKRIVKRIQRTRLALRWKVLGGFFATNLLLLIALGASVFTVIDSSSALKNLKSSSDRTQLLQQIEISETLIVNRTLDYAWSSNLARLNDYDFAKTQLNRALAGFRPRPLQQENFANLTRELKTLTGILDQIIQLNDINQDEQAQDLWRTQGSRQSSQVRAILGELSQQELQSSAVDYQDTLDQNNFYVWILAASMGVAIIAAIALSLLLTTALVEPIQKLRQRLFELADGDLSNPVEIPNRDEIGDLARTYNATLTSLRELITGLYAQSQQVTSATEELTLQASSQVAGSSQQVSAVTEATHTVEELNQTASMIAQQSFQTVEAVNYSLERAKSINRLAEAMVRAQQEGRSTVAESIAAIYRLKEQVEAFQAQQKELAEKSTIIQRVISLIDNIAKETHLLSLNAAIEARGAGIYGERFAIIAGEVKRLAERSVTATQEVRVALGGISQAVEATGSQTVQGLQEAQQASKKASGADQALLNLALLGEQVKVVAAEIVTQVETTANLATNIGIATRQQQSASQQILDKMLEIEAVTSQNLSSIRQGEAATRQLSSSAHLLVQSANTFKLAA